MAVRPRIRPKLRTVEPTLPVVVETYDPTPRVLLRVSDLDESPGKPSRRATPSDTQPAVAQTTSLRAEIKAEAQTQSPVTPVVTAQVGNEVSERATTANPSEPVEHAGKSVKQKRAHVAGRFVFPASILHSRKVHAVAVFFACLTIGGTIWKLRGSKKAIAAPTTQKVAPGFVSNPPAKQPAVASAPIPAPVIVAEAKKRPKPAPATQTQPTPAIPLNRTPPRPMPIPANTSEPNGQPVWSNPPPDFTLPRTAAAPRMNDNAALPVVTDAAREPLPAMPLAFPNPYVAAAPQTGLARTPETPRVSALPRADQFGPQESSGARFEGMIQPLPVYR